MLQRKQKTTPLTVLIVEDSPIQALFLKRILEKAGYTLYMAKNGAEGLATAMEVKPDIVITDIVMPEMDGFELCRHIKELNDLKDIPVILLTTLNDPSDVINGLKCGADNFINKPYDENNLLNRIKYILISRELSSRERTQMGIEVLFHGEKHLITSDRQQMLNLLLSTYETAILKNKEIVTANEALQAEIVLRIKAEDEIRLLFRISTALGSLIDTDAIIKEVLDIMMDLKLFSLEERSFILLNKEDSLFCAYDIGHDAEFIASHTDLKFGAGLCGIAAKTGKVVISGDSQLDPRHTIGGREIKPHGHIVIPLKSGSRLVGVLCLSIKQQRDIRIDEKTLEMLQIIGNQIGIALENARLYEEAKNNALHDTLTGLPNRRFLDIFLQKSFAVAKRGTALSVVMFDIDHFKHYNDTYGHPTGDKVLISVAQTAKKTMRESNFIARYGGEEFIILLLEADAKDAITVAERLRENIEMETEVTVSLGISTYYPSIISMDELIKNADRALYEAKKSGRNCFCAAPYL